MLAQNQLETKPQAAPWQWAISSIMFVIWTAFFTIFIAVEFGEAGKPLPQWMTHWLAPLEPVLPYLLGGILLYLIVPMLPALWIKVRFRHPKKANEEIYIKQLDSNEIGESTRSFVIVEKPLSKKNIRELLITLAWVIAITALIFFWPKLNALFTMRFNFWRPEYSAYFPFLLSLFVAVFLFRPSRTSFTVSSSELANELLSKHFWALYMVAQLYDWIVQ